jgi:tRNA(Ile2) C34 agmatinyltransferase TiaS
VEERKEYAQNHANGEAPEEQAQPQLIDVREIPVQEAPEARVSDAPLCYACGAKMQPAGSCYVCTGCGSTSGCS